MALWRFFDYVTEDDEHLLANWYDAQEPEVQAAFDTTLLILRAVDDWEYKEVKEFKPLTKDHVGLGEIRFHVNAIAPGATRPHRRRFRPVGIWPTIMDREFILILGCEKSGRTYKPHAAFDLALKHKALLIQGRGTIRERL